MRWNCRKTVAVMEPDTSGPILPSTVEKIVLKTGEEVLLDNPRIRGFLEGNIISGYVVDPNTVKVTETQRVIAIEDAERHVAMGYRASDNTLHEVEQAPRSLSL